MSIAGTITNNINIGAVLKFSTLDYPGRLSAVIFCQGCPNHCVYCHNPDFIPIHTNSPIDFEEVIRLLNTRKGLLDAVVFSGGDPLIQLGIYEAMEKVRAMGFLVGLHTSGINPNMLREVIDITDWIGFDVKSTLEKYDIITQNKGSALLARKSLEILLKSNVAYEIRTTVDSRYIGMKDLEGMARMLKEMGIKKWILQECILRGIAGEEKLALPNAREIEHLRQYLEVEIRRQ